jgi:predicted ester cyclase
MDTDTCKALAISSFRLIESGDVNLAQQIIAPEFTNLEADDDSEQADRRLTGPRGFLATSAWLRSAFADLHFADLKAIAEDSEVVVLATMTGRHTGEFHGIAATQKRFRQRQIHVFRIQAGKIAHHLAQRDDLGLLLHLGWSPGHEGATGRGFPATHPRSSGHR